MNRTGAPADHRAARELVTPQRLRAFFAPRSIALVGASDNSGWARFIVASCAATGFAGPLTAVHPRARSAFGLPVVPSLRDLPEPADLAFILTPVQAVEGVLDDMGAASIPNAVVLASGYREVGADGRALEDALAARAIANDVTQPANLDAVAAAIAGFGHTALALNGALRALEVNPLWVNGDQVEALDVLVVTGPEGTE